MVRYIDAEKAINSVDTSVINSQYAISIIKSATTEDVVPVVHAHWIRGGAEKWNEGIMNIMHCSNCKALFRYQGRKKNVNYCYRCGAKMDEEVQL